MNSSERFWRQLISKAYCGLGSVIVPSDVDRQQYIDNCFSTETVSVMPQIGGMAYNRVPISLEALQHIEFPEEGNNFGSQVVYLFHPVTRFPIIVAVVDKKSELYGVQWKQFKQFKEHEGSFVSVIGDGKRGSLYVTVLGTEKNKGGQILIDVLNGDKKGLLKVSVQGDIELITNNLHVNSVEVQLNSKTIKLLAQDKVSLGSQDYQPLVLGKNLVDDILMPLLSALQALTVVIPTGMSGPPSPNFIGQIVKIRSQLQKVLSKKVETE